MDTKDKQDKYFVTRYSLIEDIQMTIEDYLEPKSKEDVFNEWISSLIKIRLQTITLDKNEYKICYINNITPVRYLIKFARKADIIINEPTDTDITLKQVEDYPNSYIIIDTERQLILIQKNSYVAREYTTFNNHIERALNSVFESSNITIQLHAITGKSNFWEAVNAYEGVIKEVNLTLVPPNFLGQNYEATKVMKEFRDETNNDKLDINLFNNKGELKIPKTSRFFNNSLEYISNGCGEWSIKTKDNFKVKSNDQLNEYLLDSDIEKLSDGQINDIKDIFNKINQLENENHKKG